ncbi:rho GTPase-activating protein 27 isoform X1 [Ctenopharyngodon idella]|uniref:rho GTPase-activating protein 27 isoform X1 n=1 Tax=Ctenopharyngodon idella TaxID=7959 RepID=UPI002232B1F0|nr:rho GTPase-activating protein 27 isoform X1 [Ctenopharyngodon idella]XP_051770140.1 rho GTPase-activating protein 27 isoform X1 [Ctenopharyngodon idella]
MSLSQQVLVKFEYEYTARDGRTVSIKPNEHYTLVSKTNETWWHVRRDETEKPFFIPATYVTELAPETNQTPLDPPEEFSGCEPLKSSSETASDSLPANIKPAEVTLRVPDSIKRDTEKDGHRISTYIIPKEFFELKGLDPDPIKVKAEAGPVPELQIYDNVISKPDSPSNGETPPSILLPPAFTDNTTQSSELEIKSPASPKERPRVDSKSLDQDIQMLIRAGWSEEMWNLMDKDKNVYESIDTVREPESSKPDDSMTQSPTVPSPVTPDNPLVEDDSSLTAVYVNIPRLRRSTIDSSSPIAPQLQDFPDTPDTLLLDSAGWEVHTDDQSGKEYYYQPSTGRSTWDYPLSYSMDSSVGTEEARSPPSFPQSPTCSPVDPSPQRWSSDWEKVLDENSGRHYFFNSVSGQSSWDPPEDVGSPGNMKFLEDFPPPLPEEDYPASPELEEETSPHSLPAEYSLIQVKKVSIPRVSLDNSTPPGWTLRVDPEGTWVFTSDYTQEQWIKSLDDQGRTYYYLRDGSKSQWNLPEYSGNPGQYGVGNGEQDTMGSMQSWRHSTGYQEDRSHSSYPQNTSDSDASSSPEMPHNFFQVSNLEKAGILNKTKVSENGKKIRKNWGHSWTVLHGGILTFHKDPKSTPTGASSKTNHIVPEFTVDLRGATVGWANKDKSSKKNVMELKSRNGAEYLIQYDTESIITDWYKVIVDTISQLDLDQHHSEDEEEISEKSSLDREEKPFDKRTMSNASRLPSSSSTSEADQKKVRTKLKKFLLKRPTLQSVKDKGYIRENVFGCHLHNLCNQEKTRVPSFVEKCIRAVEKRGLGIDGLYRVSGNLAVIQKLRFKADHEDLDLEEGNWDIHVITGALKLFFRELQEPLFPYNLFNDFICGIKIPDYYSKISHMRNVVRSLPAPNRDTMEALFSHLRKVIQHGDENRMTVQNVAIVFGPTLLKPEVESANIATYMVFQNQIVEFLLNEFESIFHM